jgi:hypothetical protein
MNGGQEVGAADMHGQGKSCSASSMASRSASASLSSIHCVGFQPIFPSARTYRIASPACSNSEKTSETRACRPFGGRLGFSLLARDIYPEFQLFGHPQFHMLALVLAIESLGQISVLRIGRPRHTARKGTLNSGSIISHEIFRLSILRRSSSDFLLTDSRRIYAVKYRQQYANFSFDITGSYLTVLGLRLHKSQRPAGEPPITRDLVTYLHGPSG